MEGESPTTPFGQGAGRHSPIGARSAVVEFPDEGTGQSNEGGFCRSGKKNRCRSLHCCLGRPEPRFETLTNTKAVLFERAEIVAVEMPVAPDDPSIAGAILEVRRAAQRHGGGMQIGHDHTTAWMQNPAQLGDGSSQIGDMLESQSTHNKIDALRVKRQRAQIAHAEPGLGNRPAGDIQHLG